MRFTSLLACLLLATATAAPARAQESQDDGILEMLPGEDALRALERAMQDQPENLDNFFQYGQICMQLGFFANAAKAYEHMLALNPGLDRVKLDLGLAYMRMKEYGKASKLLKEVRERDIPPPVRQNIDFVLAQMEQESETHFFSGNLGFGLNYDTNGNSSSDSGRVTVLDTSIPLGNSQKEQKDLQAFATVSLTHRYRPQNDNIEDAQFEWVTTGSIYSNEQEHLDELNLKVLSLQTGPSFLLEHLDTRVNLTQSYTHVILDGYSYLRVTGTKLGAEYFFSKELKLETSLLREYRDFLDSPTVSTYDDRTGPAGQFEIGFNYLVAQTTLLDGTIALRHEDTKRAYYDNNQLVLSFGVSHQFGEGYFARGDIGYRESVYDEPDAFISTTRRHDYDKTAGITVGKQLSESVVTTFGYQFRDVNSTIENYAFDNHRLSSNIGWRF